MTGASDHRGRRALLIIATLAILSYVVIVLALQRSMLFPRSFALPRPDGGANVEGLSRLEIESDQGPVEAYFLPGRGVDAAHPGPVVLFAHGNAELIDYWTEELAPYREMGVSVFLPEYRGYGRSAGSPSESAIHEDFLAFHALLVERPDVDASRLVYHGRSLGGGAVCALAADRPPAAMVLQSTFESIPAVAAQWLIPSFLILDQFDNLSVVRDLDAKLLVVHGRADQTIPFSHGRTLATAARDARFVAYDAGHNDCPPAREMDDYWERIRALLVDAEILARPATGT